VRVNLECSVWDGRCKLILVLVFGTIGSTFSELVSLSLFGLLGPELVGTVCGGHKDEEHREGDNGLSHGDLTVPEDPKHPAVGDQTESGSDAEHSKIEYFLHSEWRSVFQEFFFGTGVVFGRDRSNRNARDNKEVESS